MTNEEFRKLFYKVNRIAIKNRTVSAEFDHAIEERYDSTYSDNDIDEIIDCLDYGLDKMTFTKFKELMKPFGTNLTA